MPAFKIAVLGLLCSFASLALGSKCPPDAISKLVVCYYKNETSLTNFNVCNCTHLVFTNAVRRAENNTVSTSEDTTKLLYATKERKENLSALFTLSTKPEETSAILKSENRSSQLVNGIVEFLQESSFDGIELDLKFVEDDGVVKESYASFVKSLAKTLSSRHRRVKREGYDVFEKVPDDITTASYTTQTPKNSTSKTQSIKDKYKKPKGSNRKIREEKNADDDDDDDENNADYATLEEAINAKFSEDKSENRITLKDVEGNFDFEEKKFLIFVRLPIKPEIIAKKYDLKTISRYANILTVPTHNIVNADEENLTYHPSRLMGLSDILNTDSILDFLTGMGAPKSKMVISLPATVLKFQLKDEDKNTPRSPARSKPQVIDQSQLCSLFNKNNWTIERDDDLTAPYAFSGKTWLAFEDEISVNIKGKYILLRELAGGAIYPIDADLNDGLCSNRTGSGGYLSAALRRNFERLERKPRALVLESLQEDIHENAFTTVEAGVKLSEYRIVRVVDHSGAVHVIRKNTKTQFECSRQGYFSHPLGCNKFYRCVKFDQYSDEFTVFEYDCPTGLAFDERWEVCVWPGSLPHGAPCTGSSEIAPVPRSHYQCPNREGYYADPENCRWFFACLDHASDGITPLTAYEFRCPFGLVFSEEKLACDWPWLVGTCGNKGSAGFLKVNSAGQSQGFHSATFINGGNLEASFGQYGNTDEESSFVGFGKKFGSILKGAGGHSSQGAYQGSQSAGFGYIASQYEDHHDRGSFAAFPEYQISGGRILNKGGLILDHNVAGISSIAAGGEGRSGTSKGLLQQGISQFNDGSQTTFQKLEPTLQTNTLEISGVSSGGQASFQHSVSTPTPFAVNIPSVEINAEKHSEYSGQSAVGQTTPRTVTFKQIPLLGEKENLNVHFTTSQHLNGKGIPSIQGFGVSQPAFSVGASTPTEESHAFGISGGHSVSLSTPTVSFTPSPKPEIHRFGQTQFIKGISVNQASVTAGVPVVTGTGSFRYSSAGGTASLETVPVVPVVTPKPVVGTFKYTAGGVGVGVSHSLPTENPYVGFAQISHGRGDGKAVSVDVSANVPTVQSHIVGVSQPLATETPLVGFTQINHGSTARKTVSVDVSAKVPAVQNHVIGISQPLPTESSFSEFTSTNHRSNAGKAISVEIPAKVPVAQIHTVGVNQPLPTGNPFVAFSQINHGNDAGKTVSVNIPAVQTHVINNVNEGLTANVAFRQTGVSYGASIPTATPSVYAGTGKVGSESHLSAVFSGPTPTPFVHSSIDEKVTNELRFNTPSAVPVVTPKPEFHSFSKENKYSGTLNVNAVPNRIPAPARKPDYQIFSQDVTGKTDATFTYGVPTFTPQPDLNLYGEQAGGVSVTPVVPFASPEVTATAKGSFGHAGVGYSEAVAVPQIEVKQTSSFQPKGISHVEKTSYSVPLVHTGGVSFGTPKPETQFSHSSAFGQRYSSQKQSGSQFGTVQPFGAVGSTQAPAVIKKTEIVVPKVEEPNVLTEISIEPQQIISVGTVTSTGSNQNSFGQHGAGYSASVSTPSSQSVFSQSPSVSSVNFKSTYVRPQHVTVTTPAPAVSITPSTPVTYDLHQPLNVFGTSSHSVTHTLGEKFAVETSGPAIKQTVVSAPENVIFNKKTKQEIKSFSPVVSVTTSAPFYNQGISAGFGAKTAYLPPVTPKVEIFASTLQQSAGQLGTTDRNQFLVEKEQQEFDFLKTKQFGGQRTEFIQYQAPVQVTAAVPQYDNTVKIEEPVVTTVKPFTPREQLVELEISKSVEINPAEIPAVGYHSPNPSAGSIVIEQEPLHLVSQKTFQAKPVVTPSKQQEIIHAQVNTLPEHRIQEQYVFQQQVHIKSPPTPQPKQYLPPKTTAKVSYSPAKTINIQRPVVYSQESVAPALPIFDAPRVPLSSKTETFISKITENSPPAGFAKSPAFETREEAVSSKVNLLLPTVTELPQFTPEELSVQTHRSFDSQKINKFESVHSVFNQPEIKSTPSVFGSSGSLFQYNSAHNFTTGHSAFGSGVKYSINPNIAIPEPPKEYVLAQNAYTTVAPEIVTEGQFQSTESIRSGVSGSTYLPPQVPSRRKPSKTTIITVGNLDEDEVHEDNIQQLVEKYSGKFGEVISGENVVTKVIKGEGRGKFEVDKYGSSTVQYEVSSTTPRQRGRGRQYHGAITSGLEATNKYEEYEIEGERDGQRSFDGGEEKPDSGKTTLDLKNLKLEKDKKTVIVVSQVSDANPILIGKLAGQCSCQSNMLELRNKGSKSKNRGNNKNQHLTITNEYLPPFENDKVLTQGQASSVAPETVVIGGSRKPNHGISYTTEQNFVSTSTTVHPDVASSTLLSSLGPDGVLSITPKALYSEDALKNKRKQFRGRTRYLPPVASLSEDGTPLLSPVPASEIASTFDYSILKGDESRTQNEIDGGSPKHLSGAAFDRYGPGGWRSFDETLQGSIDCKRPGLFRHPKYCNKFYACNYDPWKERYTLHVFNCPIQLTYDSSISACNWPVRGPACADDNLLV